MTYTLNPLTRTLHFSGPCLDTLHECAAMCCRQWDVGLSQAEAECGRYECETICNTSRTPCSGNLEKPCLNRSWRIKKDKREPGSCIYLTCGNTCSVYETRPEVCREFSCRKGWQLGGVQGYLNDFQQACNAIDKIADKIADEMVFAKNPIVFLKTVFKSEETSEIILVCGRLDKCQNITIRAPFCPSEGMSEEAFVQIPNLFDGKKTLDRVAKEVQYLCEKNISIREIGRIIAMLFVNNIIVCCK